MAIVRADFVKRGKSERGVAKANIRYIQNRRGQDGAKISRTLFGTDGTMDRQEAYRMIDEAPRGSIFFRIKISPDPAREDTGRDLDMRELIHKTMQALESRVDQPVSWVGALHDDHSPLRHAHVLAIVQKRLYREDFEHLIHVATQTCLDERRGLDLGRVPKVWQHLTKRRIFSKARLPRPEPQGRPAPRTHTCTCPHCKAVQMKHAFHEPHQCVSCGLILHRQKQLKLQRKEATWER